jgi:hypothetical protein
VHGTSTPHPCPAAQQHGCSEDEDLLQQPGPKTLVRNIGPEDVDVIACPGCLLGRDDGCSQPRHRRHSGWRVLDGAVRQDHHRPVVVATGALAVGTPIRVVAVVGPPSDEQRPRPGEEAVGVGVGRYGRPSRPDTPRIITDVALGRGRAPDHAGTLSSHAVPDRGASSRR